MKNNKGFISISIIYSFFIVFLLLLVLIMTTYTTNRYSFNIFMKDEKKFRASITNVLPNELKLVDYNDDVTANHGYYSYYYHRNNGEQVIGAVNYFFYPSKNISVGNMYKNRTTNIYIILGKFSDHSLNYTSFFNSSFAHQVIEISKTNTKFTNTSNTAYNVMVTPSLYNKYASWTEAMNDPEGVKDIENRLVMSLLRQLTGDESASRADFTDLNIYYLGYEDGGTAVTKYVANYGMGSTVYNDTKYPNVTIDHSKDKYYVLDGEVVCTNVQCFLSSTEENNIRNRATTINYYDTAKSDNTDIINLMNGFNARVLNGFSNISTYSDNPANKMASIITGA